MKLHPGWSLALLAGAAIFGGGWIIQQREGEALRAERDLLREQRRQAEVQRVWQTELRSRQPADDELARLRADRAALERLRAEVAASRARVEQAESLRVAPPVKR